MHTHTSHSYTEPPSEPVDMDDLELPRGEIGEIVVSGWHVNTYQVHYSTGQQPRSQAVHVGRPGTEVGMHFPHTVHVHVYRCVLVGALTAPTF